MVINTEKTTSEPSSTLPSGDDLLDTSRRSENSFINKAEGGNFIKV